MKTQKTYRIRPILTCKLKMSMGEFTYRRNYDKWVVFPVFSFLVEGGREPFLIDTGVALKDMAAVVNPAVWHGGEEGAPIETKLPKMGIQPSEIKTIILTHIHLDHFLNAKKFPGAKLIVQEKELAFAQNPHPLFAKTYQPELLKGLTFETISGDTELMPGVEIIHTPGHSPGSQSVVINTDKGKVVLVGYCALDENFTPAGDFVPGMHTDLFQAYDSMVRLKKTGYMLIPTHSQRIIGLDSIP